MPQEGKSGGDWPLVGRSEELELLRTFRSPPSQVSAMISGPAGVGKSRLARAALAQASREGWATLTLRGSQGWSAVPLGPFRTVLQVPALSGLAELTQSVADQLAAMRTSRGLLLSVDDCQALDDASAGLLHQLVSARLVVAIITVRAGSTPPPAVTDLWKDGFVERIELQNLSMREAAELLNGGLGGHVPDSIANRMWHLTGGNPLYLREVVLSSHETGALRQVDGEWRWEGEWASGSRIQEIVAARLGRLHPDELTAVEMLALAGSLPLLLVSELTTARAVEELEARALLTTERSGRRLEVSIAHPLHAEVVRSKMPELQRRAIRRNLVDALEKTGARRQADKVRIACWSLEEGGVIDPVTLALSSNATLFGIGHTIAGRLNEILPGIDIETAARPAVHQDHELSVRLARAAYDRSGGIAEGAQLVSALGWTGATEAAEAVLAELAAKATAVDDRLRLALGLGWVRFWCHYHVEEAWDGLREAAAEAERSGGYDGFILAEIYQEMAGIALNTGRPRLALEYAERTAATQGVPLAASLGAPPACAALGYLGRCEESAALADEAVPAAQQAGHPLAVPTLLFAKAGALGRFGRLEEARELVAWLREVALSAGVLDATATVGVLLGELLLRQGSFASAGRIFRDSAGLLAERDVLGYRPWALTGLARARVRAGEEESASEALEEARRSQPIARHFDMGRYLAEVDLHRLAGRADAAAEAARRGAEWARDNEMLVDEAQALDALVRLDHSGGVVERLGELAAATDSRYVKELAEHARALVEGDPDALLATAARFAEMAAWWLAAEAAGSAARLLERRREPRAARAAFETAAHYASRCEGARPTTEEAGGGPAKLTKREREIATFAAAGQSGKEIAERMFLSRRTVENHLYHAYLKLGVTNKAELSAALERSGAAGADPVR